MQNPGAERRSYERHPIRVPLAVRPRDGSRRFVSEVGDLSEGGLSFACPEPMPEGSTLEIELPVNNERFMLIGAVASCVEATGARTFRVGLAFVNPEMHFRMKIAEQFLRISELQRDLSRERGAEVSIEEAAQRWVDQYAKSFADLYPKD